MIYRLLRRIKNLVLEPIDHFVTYIKFKGSGVSFSNFRTTGFPEVYINRGGILKIGKNFAMNNGPKGNPIGCYEPCTFSVGPNGRIEIGKNVGISQTALVAFDNIIIGDFVKIGGGTVIYTSDFHSLNPDIRRTDKDTFNRVSKPVEIQNNVFIGAKTIILKGVTIGENSIIGAGSVVTKDIPSNEIWAGNPARFIRKNPIVNIQK